MDQENALSEPRRKHAWGVSEARWSQNQPAHMDCIGQFGTPVFCGFCGINLVNVPEGDRKSARPIVSQPPQNRNASYLLTRVYCSETCTIREAMEFLGAIHKDAFIKRMLSAHPSWETEASTFNKISITRDCRKGQVLALPRQHSSVLGVKYARREPTAAVSPADRMAD